MRLFLQLFFEAGQLAVLQLGGLVQIVGALGLLDFGLHVVDLRPDLALFLERFLIGLPLGPQARGGGLQLAHFLVDLAQALARGRVGFFLQALRARFRAASGGAVASSSSAGMESISVRSLAAASSTRSMALSGRNRSEM